MKNRTKIIIGILIIVLLIPPFNYFVLKDSVMEDIYRSVYWLEYNMINRMEGIEHLDYKEIEVQIWEGDGTFLRVQFEEEYLDENYTVSIYFPSREEINNDTISIVGVYRITNEVSVRMGMQYDHRTRTMTYEPLYVNEYSSESSPSLLQYFDEETVSKYLNEYDITREDIKEYQHYILYDVVYQSWISGTDNGRKLNKWDYLNIKEVDNTFNFEVTE